MQSALIKSNYLFPLFSGWQWSIRRDGSGGEEGVTPCTSYGPINFIIDLRGIDLDENCSLKYKAECIRQGQFLSLVFSLESKDLLHGLCLRIQPSCSTVVDFEKTMNLKIISGKLYRKNQITCVIIVDAVIHEMHRLACLVWVHTCFGQGGWLIILDDIRSFDQFLFL